MGRVAEEIEAKFYLPGLQALRGRLLEAGASLLSERHLEKNWRFDRPDGQLTAVGHVLRLRQGPDSTLTYKQRKAQAERRGEIEFELDDPEAAVSFLNALGYQVVASYEKYREVFSLDGCQVMLDELPFGTFVEIEGPSLDQAEALATRLGFDWSLRVAESYLELYHRLRPAPEMPPTEVTFAQFQGRPAPDPKLMAVRSAWSDPGRASEAGSAQEGGERA